MIVKCGSSSVQNLNVDDKVKIMPKNAFAENTSKRRSTLEKKSARQPNSNISSVTEGKQSYPEKGAVPLTFGELGGVLSFSVVCGGELDSCAGDCTGSSRSTDAVITSLEPIFTSCEMTKPLKQPSD